MFKKFIVNWRAETPKFWKGLRDAAGIVTTSILVLSGIAGVFPSLNVPTWFSNYGWYIAGACALITAFSGQKKVEKSEIPTNPEKP